MELGKIIIKNKKIHGNIELSNLIKFYLEKYDRKYKCKSVPITSIKFDNCEIEGTRINIHMSDGSLSNITSIRFLNCKMEYAGIETEMNYDLSLYFDNSDISYFRFYSRCYGSEPKLDSVTFNSCFINNLNMEGVTVLRHTRFNSCHFFKKLDNTEDNVIKNNTFGYSTVFNNCTIVSLIYTNNSYNRNPNSGNPRYTLFSNTIIDNKSYKEKTDSIIRIMALWENIRFRNTIIKSANVINNQTCFQVMMPFNHRHDDTENLYGLNYYYFPNEDKLYEDLDISTNKYSFINSHISENDKGYVTFEELKEMVKVDNSNVNVETYNRYTLVRKYFEEVKNLEADE